jgi:error-prone DNA polymerase
VVVSQRTQQQFRQALMSAQLLLINGTVETKDNVIHIIAGALYDYTGELENLRLKSRNFH